MRVCVCVCARVYMCIRVFVFVCVNSSGCHPLTYGNVRVCVRGKRGGWGVEGGRVVGCAYLCVCV